MLLLVVLVGCFYRGILGHKVWFPGFTLPFVAYGVVGILSTGIEIASDTLPPIRGFFFLLKEWEYFVLGLAVSNTLRTETDIKLGLGALLLGGCLNGIWVVVQLIGGFRQTFFDLAPDLVAGSSYGPQLIGERSPFAAGGLFLSILVVSLCVLAHSRGRGLKCVLILLSATAVVGLTVAESRVSVISAAVAVLIVLISRHKKQPSLAWSALVVVLAAISAFIIVRSDSSRLTLEGIENSSRVRSDEIWPDLVAAFWESPVIGHGKGSLGTSAMLWPVEAHNHFLRTMVECGLCGVLLFVYFVSHILRTAWRYARRDESSFCSSVSSMSLGVTAGLIVASTVQDAFTPVMVNEVWWVIIGLSYSAQRICLLQASTHPLPIYSRVSPYSSRDRSGNTSQGLLRGTDAVRR